MRPFQSTTLDVSPPEPLVFPFTGSVYTGVDSYRELSRLYHTMRDRPDCLCQLDWEQLEHLDANLSAVLAAIANHTADDNGTRLLMDPTRQCQPDSVFVRNGLAGHLANDGTLVHDERQSTIPVCCFTIDQVDAFVDYVDVKLLGHRGLRQLTAQQREKIASCFYELFGNVEQHARINHVAVCGQYFPAKGLLIFTMVDFGVGFFPGVHEYALRMGHPPINTPRDAITWALKGGSTKTQAQGGSGLLGIVKQCQSTNSSIHVATSGGYFLYDPLQSQPVVYEAVDKPLPGTLIHLLFRIF